MEGGVQIGIVSYYNLVWSTLSENNFRIFTGMDETLTTKSRNFEKFI